MLLQNEAKIITVSAVSTQHRIKKSHPEILNNVVVIKLHDSNCKYLHHITEQIIR